ncbi:MAG: hypothetical protein NZ825_10355, partial [Candidatus Marinimicrobia bacterium]|nr:hypothetical protein [Candidatus Neomarinimicrobiota bacterium]
MTSSNIKTNIANAERAVNISAIIGDNRIIAFEFSTLGMSLIIVAHSQALNLRFFLIHCLPYQQ